MKWQKKKTELGLNDNALSISVRKKIAQYEEFRKSLLETKTDLKAAKNDADKDQLQVEIDTLEKGLLNLDTVLTKDIERLHKHGDRYKQMATRLPRKAAGSKKTPEAVVAATTAAVVETTPPAEPEKPAAQTPPTNGQTKKIQTPPSPPPKQQQQTSTTTATKKKKDNTGVIAGVVLGLIAIGSGAWWWFFKKKK